MAARALAVRHRQLHWPAFANETPDSSVYVEARLRGVTARAVTLAIDGKTVGTETLRPGFAPRGARAPPAPLTLAPGSHELTMRFVGGPRSSDEPLAELDWAHVGTGDSTEPYAAPTRADVVVDTAVGGRSLRALSLRAPGFVRCATWMPANATVEASLATVGGGDADVEARLVRDRHAPVVLGTAHVAGGGLAWAPWSVPVTGLEGAARSASLESWSSAPPGARACCSASPARSSPSRAPLPPPPTAKSVLLIVLGQHGRQGARALGRTARGARAVAARERRDHVRGQPRHELARGLGARDHADGAPRARARPGRSRRAPAARPHDPRGGLQAGRPGDGRVHGQPDDRRGVRLRPRMGHLHGARSPGERARHRGLRRRGRVDRRAQGRALPRGGARAGWPSAVGGDARAAQGDAPRQLPGHPRTAARGRGPGQGAQARGPLQGGRPRAGVGRSTITPSTPTTRRSASCWRRCEPRAARTTRPSSSPATRRRPRARPCPSWTSTPWTSRCSPRRWSSAGPGPRPSRVAASTPPAARSTSRAPSSARWACPPSPRRSRAWTSRPSPAERSSRRPARSPPRARAASPSAGASSSWSATTTASCACRPVPRHRLRRRRPRDHPLALEPIHRWAVDALAPMKPPPYPREPVVLDEHPPPPSSARGRPSDDRDPKDDH